MWGDTIDSLRSFEAESQRSIENLEEITLYRNGTGADGRTEAGRLEENSTGSGKSRKEVPRPDEK